MLRDTTPFCDGLIRRQGLLTLQIYRCWWSRRRASWGGAGSFVVGIPADGAFDHWLLDEFQDTSAAQWRVVENLLDEAVQDPDRSFFCVGDETIHLRLARWCPRLFGRVEEHYRLAPAESLRCSPWTCPGSRPRPC